MNDNHFAWQRTKPSAQDREFGLAEDGSSNPEQESPVEGPSDVTIWQVRDGWQWSRPVDTVCPSLRALE